MKLITDMLFEGCTKISTNLDRVDLLEHAANSVLWQVVFGRALQLIGVLLVSDLSRSAPLDSIRPVLFCCVSLVVDEERVHFRSQSKEIGDRLADRLVLEFANHFIVGRVEEWARLVERGEVEVLPLGE